MGSEHAVAAGLLEVFPVLPLIASEPLGAAGLSYPGQFTIGVVADRHAYPDLDVFWPRRASSYRRSA